MSFQSEHTHGVDLARELGIPVLQLNEELEEEADPETKIADPHYYRGGKRVTI